MQNIYTLLYKTKKPIVRKFMYNHWAKKVTTKPYSILKPKTIKLEMPDKQQHNVLEPKSKLYCWKHLLSQSSSARHHLLYLLKYDGSYLLWVYYNNNCEIFAYQQCSYTLKKVQSFVPKCTTVVTYTAKGGLRFFQIFGVARHCIMINL